MMVMSCMNVCIGESYVHAFMSQVLLGYFNIKVVIGYFHIQVVIEYFNIQVVIGSIGKITLTSIKWYHMHIELCLEHCMHMCLCESHVFDYVNICGDMYMTICVL